MERKRIYSLLCHVKNENGTEGSYLERMSEDEEFLKKLLNTMYDDAVRHIDGKVFTPSNPEWIDKEHTQLKITATTYCGYIKVVSTHIYTISWNWEQNINSKQIWLDY